MGTDAQTELVGAAEIGAFVGRRSLMGLYAAVLLAGGGCTSTVPPLNDGSPQGSTPNYRTIIAKSLTAKTELDRSKLSRPESSDYFRDRGGIFPADKKLGHVEISDTIRMVQTNLYGWAWEACIRLNVNNSPATYAVFISDGVVVDARAAIRSSNSSA